MLTINDQSPAEIQAAVAARLRARRLAADLTQAGLAARAGVSLGSLRRFERTGEASLAALARLAAALGAGAELAGLFAPRPLEALPSLEAALAERRPRRRGRRA